MIGEDLDEDSAMGAVLSKYDTIYKNELYVEEHTPIVVDKK